MPWFLFVAVPVYVLLHLVIYLRVRCLLGLGRGRRVALWALFIGLIATIPAAYYLRYNGQIELARAVMMTGYVWMGAVFFAVSASVDSWIIQLIVWGIAKARGKQISPKLRPILAICVLLATLGCTIYALHEARDVRVESLELYSDKVPADLKRVRLVLIADVHISLVNNSDWIDQVADLIAAQKPDILISAGDLLDRGLYGQEGMAKKLRGIATPLGKFAVTGNHERYAGIAEALAFTEACGFTVLRAQAASPAPWLRMVGFDDKQVAAPIDEAAMLGALPKGPYTVVIKHRPKVQDQAAGRFDLQLSGHAHNGQIWPFTYLTGFLFPLQDGLHHLAKGSLIYTSRGTGTWGPPMRLGAPPEITVIDLMPKKRE